MEQKLIATRIFKENNLSTKKINLNRGGTRSSKTYSLVQLAVVWLMSAKGGDSEVWSITRKTLPALKATAYRDFKEIMNTMGMFTFVHSNLTELMFTFNNRTIEFFALDEEQKVRSRKRDHCHVCEANEINYDTFTQLAIRTKGKMFLDWNPDDPHSWLREELEIKRLHTKKDVNVIISTYKDNPHLTKDEVSEIEYLKEIDPEMWAVFGTGEYGSLTDVIFKEYKVKEYPEYCEYNYLGIDFGFSKDPAAVVVVGRNGSNLYIKELVYQTHLTNQQLASKIKETPYKGLLAIADSAEPKSIVELQGQSLNVAGAVKGPDSIRSGIMKMREFTIHIDPGSINVLKEFRAYKWNDKKAGVPIDTWNHSIDAIRYVVSKMMRGGGNMSLGSAIGNVSGFQS